MLVEDWDDVASCPEDDLHVLRDHVSHSCVFWRGEADELEKK